MPGGQAKAVPTPTTPTAEGSRPTGTRAEADTVPVDAGVPRQRSGGRRAMPSSAYLGMAAASLGMALLLLGFPGLVSSRVRFKQKRTCRALQMYLSRRHL